MLYVKVRWWRRKRRWGQILAPKSAAKNSSFALNWVDQRIWSTLFNIANFVHVNCIFEMVTYLRILFLFHLRRSFLCNHIFGYSYIQSLQDRYQPLYPISNNQCTVSPAFGKLKIKLIAYKKSYSKSYCWFFDRCKSRLPHLDRSWLLKCLLLTVLWNET